MLGAGSYGRVFVAYHPDSLDPLALKTQHPSPGAEADGDYTHWLNRNVFNFFREVFMQIHGSGPGVLDLRGWDICLDDYGCSFLLLSPQMSSNANPLQCTRTLTATQRTILIYGIARGMAHLHGLHIVHRDLKPENVLLDDHGYPYIADLGFARVAPLKNKQMSERWGTTDYVAPEVVTSKDYSFPADVYSFAKTAFQILEDRNPVPPGIQSNPALRTDEDVDRLYDAIEAGDMPVFQKTSQPLSRLITRAWQIDPDLRPTFAAIAQEIEGNKELWVPGTDEQEFAAYRAFLREEEERASARDLEMQDPWLRTLLSAKPDALNVREILEMADYGNSRAGVASAMLFLDGNMGETNTFEAVSRLKENGELLWVNFLLKCFLLSTPLNLAAMCEYERGFAGAFRGYRAAAEDGSREGGLRFGALLLLYGAESAGSVLLDAIGRQGSLQANYTLADYYWRWKRDEERAVEYFRLCAVPEVNSQFSEPYLILGDIYVRRKQFKVARKWLNLALTVDDHAGLKAGIASKLLAGLPKA
jgi:serine/threonine protein kinase